ncbi:MAG TPA: histidine phosphatase family protein [Polyangiaceae bacterium]|nr:histidine phosphatase family protein [Polyangiaceae bacterium]
MKTLFVLRHGQAIPESQADSDHARELTPRGVAEARRAAESLVARADAPSLILSSSATRALQTAEACALALAGRAVLKKVDGLYLAEPSSYLAALGQLAEPHASVMVVGHNPGLEALIYMLTDRSEHLATASLVEITLAISAWAELSGKGPHLGRVAHTFRA